MIVTPSEPIAFDLDDWISDSDSEKNEQSMEKSQELGNGSTHLLTNSTGQIGPTQIMKKTTPNDYLDDTEHNKEIFKISQPLAVSSRVIAARKRKGSRSGKSKMSLAPTSSSTSQLEAIPVRPHSDESNISKEDRLQMASWTHSSNASMGINEAQKTSSGIEASNLDSFTPTSCNSGHESQRKFHRRLSVEYSTSKSPHRRQASKASKMELREALLQPSSTRNEKQPSQKKETGSILLDSSMDLSSRKGESTNDFDESLRRALEKAANDSSLETFSLRNERSTKHVSGTRSLDSSFHGQLKMRLQNSSYKDSAKPGNTQSPAIQSERSQKESPSLHKSVEFDVSTPTSKDETATTTPKVSRTMSLRQELSKVPSDRSLKTSSSEQSSKKKSSRRRGLNSRSRNNKVQGSRSPRSGRQISRSRTTSSSEKTRSGKVSSSKSRKSSDLLTESTRTALANQSKSKSRTSRSSQKQLRPTADTNSIKQQQDDLITWERPRGQSPKRSARTRTNVRRSFSGDFYYRRNNVGSSGNSKSVTSKPSSDRPAVKKQFSENLSLMSKTQEIRRSNSSGFLARWRPLAGEGVALPPAFQSLASFVKQKPGNGSNRHSLALLSSPSTPSTTQSEKSNAGDRILPKEEDTSSNQSEKDTSVAISIEDDQRLSAFTRSFFVLKNRDSREDRLIWTREQTENFSDWKISVAKTTDSACPTSSRSVGNDDVDDYYVHKNIVGFGPRGSSHFHQVFRMHEKSEYTIRLKAPAAEAFPTMLDYMYSSFNGVNQGKLDLSPKLAVALRYLSSKFGIPSLFDEVNQFIQKDVSKEKLHVYLKEAQIFHDEPLIDSTIRIAAQAWRGLIEAHDGSSAESTTFMELLTPKQQLELYKLALREAGLASDRTEVQAGADAAKTPHIVV